MLQKDTKVLVVDDDPQMQLAVKATLTRAEACVTVACDGRQALDYIEQESFDLIISDQRMPELTGQELLQEVQRKAIQTPFVMMTAHGTINQAVEAMQIGAADFLTKPFSADELMRVVERVLSPESKEFRNKSRKSKKGKAIVTNNPLMIRVLEVSEAVAKSDATVLIQGESGTGKELVARLIHSSSPRAEQPFVAVNCAALPATLLESELFGHEKGAFTGAQQKKIGKFELAQGGTILLDEISEMDLALQAKLLRVLQEREVDRVGGRDPVSIDVRVLATTNRNLDDAVKLGAFRADLFYRLNVIPLTLPALRERVGDVKLLAEHFMAQYLGKDAPRLSADILAALENYAWPGNIRELQNAVERAAILSRGYAPRESDFLLGDASKGLMNIPLRERVEVKTYEPAAGAEVQSAAYQPLSTQVIVNDNLVIKPGITVGEMEKLLILETLKSTENNRTKAAQLLGISIRTLRNKLHEYGYSALEAGE